MGRGVRESLITSLSSYLPRGVDYQLAMEVNGVVSMPYMTTHPGKHCF